MISEQCQCFCHFHIYCCHRSNAVHVRDVLPPYGLEVRFIYNFWSYSYFLLCTYTILFSVIVYDRFGLHREYLESILTSHGFYYHPFTVYQLAQPSKYNSEYAKRQGFGNKYYYKMTNVNDFKLMKRKLQRIIGKSCQAIVILIIWQDI